MGFHNYLQHTAKHNGVYPHYIYAPKIKKIPKRRAGF